jgi:hypothetical protein
MTGEAAPAPSSATLNDLINEISGLPSEKFKLALQATEAQLTRDHEFRMKQEENRVLDAASARAHVLYARGLIAGFLLSAGMITASVIVGLQGHVLLATSLSGPCLIILAALFVLRKLETNQLSIVSRPQTGVLKAVGTVSGSPPA